MAPKASAISIKAGAKDPNPKQTIESTLYANASGDEGHCDASVRSQETETTLQDTANAAANVSAEPLDFIEPVDLRDSAEVPSPAVVPESNGIRTTDSENLYHYINRLNIEQPAKDVELEVADFLVTKDFLNRWASRSLSDTVSVAASTILQFKSDPNFSAPVHKEGGT